MVTFGLVLALLGGLIIAVYGLFRAMADAYTQSHFGENVLLAGFVITGASFGALVARIFL